MLLSILVTVSHYVATNQITVCVTVHYASLDDLVPGLFGASVLTHFPETDRQVLLCVWQTLAVCACVCGPLYVRTTHWVCAINLVNRVHDVKSTMSANL